MSWRTAQCKIFLAVAWRLVTIAAIGEAQVSCRCACGAVAGLGKGVTISSIGVLLKACGLRVSAVKIDPYLNIDAGTMNPVEHGEVFVLEDGGETDLDLGNYERFMDIQLTKDHNITSGMRLPALVSRFAGSGFFFPFVWSHLCHLRSPHLGCAACRQGVQRRHSERAAW
jgi:hypothetical protein